MTDTVFELFKLRMLQLHAGRSAVVILNEIVQGYRTDTRRALQGCINQPERIDGSWTVRLGNSAPIPVRHIDDITVLH